MKNPIQEVREQYRASQTGTKVVLWMSLVLLVAVACIYIWFPSDTNHVTLDSALFGGALSGLITLLGVLLTIEYTKRVEARRDERETKDHIRARLNHLRLLSTEIKLNKQIVEKCSTHGDWRSAVLLSSRQWEAIAVTLDWLPFEHFEKLAEVHFAFDRIRYMASIEPPTAFQGGFMGVTVITHLIRSEFPHLSKTVADALETIDELQKNI